MFKMLIHLLAFLCNSRPLTGLIHPVKGTSTQPNFPYNKPLEGAATILHPLPKKLQENAQEIQFHSARESKAAKKDDPFAEQNAKRAERQKQRSKRRKRTIRIVSAFTGLVAVCIGVCLAIVLGGKNEPEVSPSEVNEERAQTAYRDAIDQINIEAINGFPTENDISEANIIFENSISQAVESKDTNAADALRIAQMMFYNDVSTEYAKIIEIGESVENIQALEKIQQLRYYSLMATAYSEVGDRDRSVEAYFKAVVLAESIEN